MLRRATEDCARYGDALSGFLQRIPCLSICALTKWIDVEDGKLGGLRAGQIAQTKPGALIGRDG
jgi:hypothetical protein